MLIQFLLTLISSAIVVSGVSFAWPRFTAAPRPQPLESVHSVVMKTPVGTRLEEVLGVSDTPGNIGEQLKNTAGTIVSNVANSVEGKTKEIITHRIVDQLMTEWDTLPATTQGEIKEVICK